MKFNDSSFLNMNRCSFCSRHVITCEAGRHIFSMLLMRFTGWHIKKNKKQTTHWEKCYLPFSAYMNSQTTTIASVTVINREERVGHPSHLNSTTSIASLAPVIRMAVASLGFELTISRGQEEHSSVATLGALKTEFLKRIGEKHTHLFSSHHIQNRCLINVSK